MKSYIQSNISTHPKSEMYPRFGILNPKESLTKLRDLNYKERFKIV